MDVTNTNFFTLACVAAAIRFLVPCATHALTHIKACMGVNNSATSYVQVEMHMHAPDKGDDEPARECHTELQTHYLRRAQPGASHACDAGFVSLATCMQQIGA